MRRLTLALLAALSVASSAQAATLALPSVTVVSPNSTSITCTPVSSSYTSPLAAGTVVFNCIVAPSNWQGAVSLSGTQFVVVGLSGDTFNLAVGSTALTVGSYAPGTLTTTP